MKISKKQIIAILLINFFMLLTGIWGMIKNYGSSDIKFVAALAASVIFLFFITIVIRKHYKLIM